MIQDPDPLSPQTARVHSGEDVLHLHLWTTCPQGARPVVFALHGFTGSGLDFAPLAPHVGATLLAPDLIGHGQSSAPDVPARYRIPAQLDHLDRAITPINATPVVLLGYSMGGRLALHLAHALRHTGRVRGVVLVGATPGILGAAEREARRLQDEALAERIERDGVSDFLEAWRRKPIIASQRHISEPWRSRMLASKQRLTAHGLAHALREAGTGSMRPLWEELHELTAPALLLTGAQDEKFTAIAQRMVGLMPRARHILIPEAGHCAHLEQPLIAAAAISAFLDALPL